MIGFFLTAPQRPSSSLSSIVPGAMPKPLRELTELGCIGRRGGQCRAEFSAWDSGRELRFEGPYRDDEDVARAAGERMARTEALQAMESQSIFLKSEAANEAGGIEMAGFEHRARVRCLDHSAELRVIKGPCRLDARRAQADLERIRAAAAISQGKPQRLPMSRMHPSGTAADATGGRNTRHK